ncbi:hypothetical protein CISIN_1g033681mg [Citrus sinensis]|uniref:PNPLA domain-containing protein n=1 Tax=Citrus sinensis TaxID=2711 RepID=A0A067EGE3_CITSI|nr:hypothetical protein CISIN_1g033681mg [Citrus sinensis]
MGRKRSILSQCDGDYQHNKIMEMLVVKFLHQTLTDVIIPTFDIRLLQPISFSTLKAKRNASKVSWLSDNCIGTSAAPYYMPPYYFEMHASTGTKKFNLVDGVVAANIPVSFSS